MSRRKILVADLLCGAGGSSTGCARALHELGAAMGFDSDEGRPYEFAGTKTEQIKQIGNAVSVRKMKACVSAIMLDAAPLTKPDDAERFPLAAAE